MDIITDEAVAQAVADALRARGCDLLRVPPETLAAMTRAVASAMSPTALLPQTETVVQPCQDSQLADRPSHATAQRLGPRDVAE